MEAVQQYVRINPMRGFPLATAIAFAAFLLFVKTASWFWFALIVLPVFVHGLIGERTLRTPIKGKSIFISGAGSGLGRALALSAARKGAARVIICGRRSAPLEETKTLIKSSTKQIEVVIHELDVADDAAVLRVAKAVIDKHGCPDILVNNAGAGSWKHIEDTTAAEARQMTAVPYLGAFYLSNAFAPAMIKRGKGHILNVTSLVSMIPLRSAVGYGVSRVAMQGLSKSLREDLLEANIGVTLLNSAEIEGTDYFTTNQTTIPWLFTLPFIKMFNKTTDGTADAALQGVEDGEVEVIVPEIDWPLLWLQKVVPDFMAALVRIGNVGKRSAKPKAA